MKKQNSTTFPTYHNNNTNSSSSNNNNNFNTNNNNIQQNQLYTQNHFSNSNNNNNTNTNTSPYNNQRQHQQRNRCQIIPSEQFLLQTQPPTQYRQQPTPNNFNYQQQQRQQQQPNISATMSSLTTSNFQTNQFNNFANQQQQYATYQSQKTQQQQFPNYANFQNSNLSQQQQQPQMQNQQQRRQQLQLPLFNQNNFNQQHSQQLQQRQQLFEQAQQQIELNVAVTSNSIAAVSNNLENCSSSLAITSNGFNGGQNSYNEIDKFSMDANEIANFIAHELLMQQLVPVDGIQSGVPTQTTATLTPTTLRNIEEAFTELIDEPITHLAQAGFIPPSYPSTSNNTTSSIGGTFNGSVPDFNDTESEDSRNSLGPHGYEDYQLGGDTTENSSATTDSTSFQTGFKNSLATSNSNSTSANDFGALVAAATAAAGKKNNGNTSSSATTVTPQPTRRSQGGRRPAKASNLSPEEEEKRRLRRERNKLAAARCRKRRVDLTNDLLGEVTQLERKREDLQKDIEMLNKEKQELEYILDAHRPTCQKIRQDLLSVSTYGGLIAPTTSSNSSNNINITGIDTTLASTGRSSPIDLKPIILNDSLLSVPHIKDEPLDVGLDSNSLDNDDDGPSSTKRMLLIKNNPMIPPPLPKISTLSSSLAAAASLNTPIVTTAPISFGTFGSIQNNALVVNTLNALNKPLLIGAKQRPTTLPTMPRNTALGLNVDSKPPTDINGVAIQTPSTGMFNFDSLMDGGTGLTPVSGPLVPTCSSQNKHPLELTTPTSEPSKLVSL